MLFTRQDLKHEDQWTDVDCLRDRLSDINIYSSMLDSMTPGERRAKVTSSLGIGRVMEQRGIGGLTPVAKRLLRRAR